MTLRAESPPVNPGGTKTNIWAKRAPSLAVWTEDHLVNRRDSYGGYYASGGGTKTTTHKDRLTRERLAAHFAATKTKDVIGLHAIGRDEAGDCWSRWGAVDIDRHDDGDPDANLKFGLILYERASGLGFIPLLYDSNGKGGYHLVLLFSRPAPAADVHHFMRWLTRDHKDHGLDKVETFPKQASLTDAHPFGNWLRVPGRHPKREHFTRVYDGSKWLDGDDAVRAIVSTNGSDPGLIPAEALNAAKPKPDKPKPSGKTASALDDIKLATDALQSLNGHHLDHYDRWLDVGFSLFSLGEIGLGLWDQWSQGSTKYEQGKCREKWGTFSTEGITLGSLFHWAKQAGWRDPRTVTLKTPAPPGADRTTPPPSEPPTAEEAPAEPQWFNTTDMGNGERLAFRFGRDLRYVEPWKKWHVWDGKRWNADRTAAVVRMAKRTVREIYREAADTKADADRKQIGEWAHESESNGRLAAMIKCASSEPEIPVLPETLDTDQWVLNCENGTLDLKTGELRKHRRDDLITALCPVKYDPKASCPLWLATVGLVLEDDRELVAFWQRLCGVVLTGAVTEQILPILYGTGANGKSTLLGVLLEMLGPDYAMKAPPELLMVKRTESHPTERAALFGKRLIVAIETGEGARINETLVKELTGGDPITARRMREDFWTFKPTHKVLLCTNHKPAVRGTDHAIWRRLRLVPFSVKIEDDKADRDMPTKLLAELPGILAWCVQGCLDWQKNSLKPPAKVMEATKAYKEDEDVIGAFVAEHCVENEKLEAKASALYDRYRKFAEGSGETPVNQKKFGTAMTERGFTRKQSNGTVYVGIGLRNDSAEDTRSK